MTNILLVEDDRHINNINRQLLAAKGYQAFCAYTAYDCLKILEQTAIDLIVLDINLPDLNGLNLCNIIKQKYQIPVLFLTALSENNDIIKGFEAGGDDYVTKPYDFEILLARIKARLRIVPDNQPPSQAATICLGKLSLEGINSTAYYDQQDLLLTKREFLFLWLMIEKAGQIVSREELYQKIWGCPAIENYNTLRVLVSRVKSKLAYVNSDLQIITKRQKGYILL